MSKFTKFHIRFLIVSVIVVFLAMWLEFGFVSAHTAANDGKCSAGEYCYSETLLVLIALVTNLVGVFLGAFGFLRFGRSNTATNSSLVLTSVVTSLTIVSVSFGGMLLLVLVSPILAGGG